VSPACYMYSCGSRGQ